MKDLINGILFLIMAFSVVVFIGRITWIKPHRNIKDASASEAIAWIFTVNFHVVAQNQIPICRQDSGLTETKGICTGNTTGMKTSDFLGMFF